MDQTRRKYLQQVEVMGLEPTTSTLRRQSHHPPDRLVSVWAAQLSPATRRVGSFPCRQFDSVAKVLPKSGSCHSPLPRCLASPATLDSTVGQAATRDRLEQLLRHRLRGFEQPLAPHGAC